MRLLTTEESAQHDRVDRANKSEAEDLQRGTDQIWTMILLILDHVGGRAAGQINDDGAALMAFVGKGNYAPSSYEERSDLLCLAERGLPCTEYGWRWVEAIVRLRLSKRQLRVVKDERKAA